MRSLSELFDEKIEREAEKFMKELIGDCEWCDLNKDSFIRGANSIKGIILELAEALEAEIKVVRHCGLNPHMSESVLHKLRKELGE